MEDFFWERVRFFFWGTKGEVLQRKMFRLLLNRESLFGLDPWPCVVRWGFKKAVEPILHPKEGTGSSGGAMSASCLWICSNLRSILCLIHKHLWKVWPECTCGTVPSTKLTVDVELAFEIWVPEVLQRAARSGTRTSFKLLGLVECFPNKLPVDLFTWGWCLVYLTGSGVSCFSRGPPGSIVGFSRPPPPEPMAPHYVQQRCLKRWAVLVLFTVVSRALVAPQWWQQGKG